MTADAGQHPSPASSPSPGGLRRGDRESFVRFYELYRVPVYGFVVRSLRGRGDAATVTREVFVRAYRELLLHNGSVDLRPWIFRVAFDTCREHLASDLATPIAPAGERRAPAEQPAALDPAERTEVARRFRQALESLGAPSSAALLLHDVQGLRPDEIAMVLGISGAAATALLFRAGEEFRRAFEELSSGRRGSGAHCRLAEQAAASAVGRGLADDDRRKLEGHAAYCRSCRKTMKAWGAGAVGLALFVKNPPLPDALTAAPIYGEAAVSPTPAVAGAGGATAAVAVSGASGAGAVARALVMVRTALASRAMAYGFAAVCLAVAVGLGVYIAEIGPRQVLLFTVRPASPIAGLPSPVPSMTPVVHQSRTRASGGQSSSSSSAAQRSAGQSSAIAMVQTVPGVSVVTRQGSAGDAGRSRSGGAGSGSTGGAPAAGHGGGSQSGGSGGASSTGSGPAPSGPAPSATPEPNPEPSGAGVAASEPGGTGWPVVGSSSGDGGRAGATTPIGRPKHHVDSHGRVWSRHAAAGHTAHHERWHGGAHRHGATHGRGHAGASHHQTAHHQARHGGARAGSRGGRDGTRHVTTARLVRTWRGRSGRNRAGTQRASGNRHHGALHASGGTRHGPAHSASGNRHHGVVHSRGHHGASRGGTHKRRQHGPSQGGTHRDHHGASHSGRQHTDSRHGTSPSGTHKDRRHGGWHSGRQHKDRHRGASPGGRQHKGSHHGASQGNAHSGRDDAKSHDPSNHNGHAGKPDGRKHPKQNAD